MQIVDLLSRQEGDNVDNLAAVRWQRGNRLTHWKSAQDLITVRGNHQRQRELMLW